MTAAAQAASCLDITHWLTWIGDRQVQDLIPSGRAVYYLAGQALLSTLTAPHVLQLALLLFWQVLEWWQSHSRMSL